MKIIDVPAAESFDQQIRLLKNHGGRRASGFIGRESRHSSFDN